MQFAIATVTKNSQDKTIVSASLFNLNVVFYRGIAAKGVRSNYFGM
jgi:hypothetical protein